MTVLRALPYLLLALVLGAAGFGAGLLIDPLDRTAQRITGELDPEAPELTRRLAQARARASSLADQLESANRRTTELQEELSAARAEIERLRARLGEAAGTRDAARERVADLEARIRELQREGVDGNGAPPPPDQAETASEPPDAPADAPTAPPTDAPADAPPDQAQPRASALDALSPSPAQRRRVQAGVEAYRAEDYTTAYQRWLTLAQAGYARAQMHLGALFFEGRGVAQDNVLAYAWLTLAQENGAEAAGDILSRLEGRISDAEREAAIDLITNARG